MTAADTLRLAARNLGQAKLRTSLTMLGVSIGIASLAGMLSLGVGLQDQVLGRFSQAGVFDSITVFSGQPAGRGGRRGRFDRPGFAARGGLPQPPGAGRNARGSATAVVAPRQLDDSSIAEIAKLEDVATVYPNVRVPLQVQYKDTIEGAAATGVPLSARKDGAFQKLSHGAFFDNEQDAACLLSLDFVKRMTDADPASLVGQTIVLSYAASGPAPEGGDSPAPLPSGSSTDGVESGLGVPMTFPGLQVRQVSTPYRIAGIVEREPGIAFGGFNISGVMIPLARATAIDRENVTNAQALLRNPGAATGPRTYQSVTVRVTHARSTTDVEDRIKAMGYNAFSVSDALEGAKRGFIILDIALALIGSIALAVSSLGIVNTMVMSILERTREIGIMKAIGGSDSDIRRIFLVEASAIGVLGGIVGVTLGWLVGCAINFGANIYIQQQGGTPANLFSLPFWLIGGAIGFSWVVSLVAGSYPASRAARLDPIQALRHD